MIFPAQHSATSVSCIRTTQFKSPHETHHAKLSLGNMQAILQYNEREKDSLCCADVQKKTISARLRELFTTSGASSSRRRNGPTIYPRTRLPPMLYHISFPFLFFFFFCICICICDDGPPTIIESSAFRVSLLFIDDAANTKNKNEILLFGLYVNITCVNHARSICSAAAHKEDGAPSLQSVRAM